MRIMFPWCRYNVDFERFLLQQAKKSQFDGEKWYDICTSKNKSQNKYVYKTVYVTDYAWQVLQSKRQKVRLNNINNNNERLKSLSKSC